MKTVVGFMNTTDEAQSLIQDLVDSGFQRDAISLMASDKERAELKGEQGRFELGERGEGAARGAGAGAALGGIAGLVIGFVSMASPDPGFIMGPLAASLTGAGVGAVTGGVIGAVTKMGVSKQHERTHHAEEVKRTGLLVAVAADGGRADYAASIMRRHGAVDIGERPESWSREGWTGVDERGKSSVSTEAAHRTEPVLETGGTDVNADSAASQQPMATDDDEFRRHFSTTYGPSGERFEAYRSAYYFAEAESGNPQLRDRDWPEVEENIHQDWEKSHPGTWIHVKEAIHCGWDKTRRHH